MAHIEKSKISVAIQAIATKENRPPEEIHQAMQEALDIAWADAWQAGNLHAQLAWQRLFPGRRKPSVEEFILLLAQSVKQPKEGLYIFNKKLDF